MRQTKAANVMERMKTRHTMFLLIALMLGISLILYGEFLKSDNFFMYLDIGADTYCSYWPFYTYLTRLVRGGSSLFWGFHMGTGSSLIGNTMMIFDPFNIVYIIVGEKLVPYAFAYTMVMKIICGGMFFYMYVRTLKTSNTVSIIFSLLYAFNGYMVLWGQHYFFGYLMVLIPLIFWGIERYIQLKKPNLLILSIGLTALYSTYFLFMLSVFIFVYAVLRWSTINKLTAKNLFTFILKFLGVYALGVSIGAVLFIPQVYYLLDSPRVGMSVNLRELFRLLKPSDELITLFRGFSNDILGTGSNYAGYYNYYESPQLYCGLSVMLILPQYFFSENDKKKKRVFAIFLLFIAVCLFFPFFPYFENLFSAYTYRWTFGIIFFALFLSSVSLDSITANGKANIKVLVITTLCLFVSLGLFVWYNRTSNDLYVSAAFRQSFKALLKIAVFIVCYAAAIVYWGRKGKLKNLPLIFLIITVIEASVMNYPAIHDRSVIGTSVAAEGSSYNDYTLEALDFIKSRDKTLYRVDKDYTSGDITDPLMQDYYGITSYNSTPPADYTRFLSSLQTGLKNNYAGYMNSLPTEETLLSDYLGIKYFLSKDPSFYRDGYEKKGVFHDVTVYENSNFLPLAFVYDQYITAEEYENLSQEEKRRALLKGFVSESENAGNLYEKMSAGDIQEVSENVFPKLFSYKSADNDPQLSLRIRGDGDGGGFWRVSFGLESSEVTQGQIYWAEDNTQDYDDGRMVSFDIQNGGHDYQIDLPTASVDRMRFDGGVNSGIYVTLSDLTVSRIIGNGAAYVSRLKKDPFVITDFGENKISGSITVGEPKMLCFTIPYSKGWMAVVDGIAVEPEKINIGFIGIPLAVGEHSVSVVYRYPFLGVGLFVSSFGVLMLLVINFVMKKRKTKSSY